MGKLIANISNYPLSDGAVAYSNKLLLEDGFSIRTDALKDYFKIIYELSKDVLFFNDTGEASHTWNDLLKKDAIFQLSRFVTLSVQELHNYFNQLPQINGFNSDNKLSPVEHKKLAWQRFSVLQYLFWYYKTVTETMTGETQPQVLSILKGDTVNNLFIRYESLLQECLTGPPVLIGAAEQVATPPFNGLLFPPVEAGLTGSLHNYYNPANLSAAPVLDIYSSNNEFEDKVKAANEYAYTFFRALMQVQQMFNSWATSKLQELTTIVNNHEPHIGLLIAFCKLVMLYDAQYNQLIHRHTSFVFNDILRLQKQPVLPDMAYVSLELAKNVNQYFLPRNSLFKAGKNSLGKTVYYQSTGDMVLNSAKIAALRSTVRLRRNTELYSVTGAGDAANTEWQANNAWLPFNDISDSYTGMGIESKMLVSMQKKDTVIDFEFAFEVNVPESADLLENTRISLLLTDGTEAPLEISSAVSDDHLLKFSTRIGKDLKVAVKTGVNARIKLASPAKDVAETDDYGLLYRFLLSQPLFNIKVKAYQQNFTPTQVRTVFGLVDGAASFVAFGATSHEGAAFRLYHPYLQYANKLTIAVNWADKLKEAVSMSINETDVDTYAGQVSSVFTDFPNNSASTVLVKLEDDLKYDAVSTLKRGTTSTTTILTPLPRVLLVKSVDFTGDLEELVYEKETQRPILFIGEWLNQRRFITSLRVPYANKRLQKLALRQRHLQLRIRYFDFYRNNQTVHLYPFGERRVNRASGLTLLPDYTVPDLGFNSFEADLYIGLTNIQPGQSISLLLDIAEETADQSELEAKVTWHYVTQEKIVPLDPSRVIDTTNHFLQPGIVQLTLPVTATPDNLILYGDNTFWLVARCDRHSDVVANVKSIKTNGVVVQRVLDVNNQEAKQSVAPATIENLFPKTANVKAVTQDTPSLNGRETETDLHYFWRSSMRLRHKHRGITQWDIEQLILEQFPNIYKVKCLNHAWYNDADVNIVAKPWHTLITLIPYYLVNAESPNFQPAITLSKLNAVKSWLQSKCSPFLSFQVLNARWDSLSVELEVVANQEILDLLYYRDQLSKDIMRFFSPWAFVAGGKPALSQKIYAATLVDFIDELPYVHHIKRLKMKKNNLEVNDEIDASTAIHFLTSSAEHTITVHPYGS